jgi:uncharacterized protein YbaP (TraB family)
MPGTACLFDWLRQMNGGAAVMRRPAGILTRFLAVTLCAAMPAAVRAGEASSSNAPEPVLEEVLVTGVQPGPGLWKVTRSSLDGERVLWILGSLQPLPKKMQWRSADLESAIAGSQHLLAPVSVDARTGVFGGLAALPSLVGVRKNPDGAKLRDLVPGDVYARWLPLKGKYLGSNGRVEKWRPIFAAGELYVKAVGRSGLEWSTSVWPVAEKLARKHKLAVTEPKITVEVEKARKAIREFKKTPLDDLDCFAKTIDRLESDLVLMRTRATAWATGDVAALREMTNTEQASACIAVVMTAPVIEERGYDDIPERMAAEWLAAAQASLDRYKSTVAVLPMHEILSSDGYLSRLRALGYSVEEP